MNHRSFLLALSVSTLTLVACGGKVVYSEDGDGGGGAGGVGGTGPGPGSSVSSTTNVATSSTVSTSSGPMNACELLCSSLELCIGPTCLQDCASIFGQGCDPQAESLLGCYVNAVDPMSCEYDGSCDQLIVEYDQCVNGGADCFETECFGGGNGCGCDGVCFQDVGVKVECNFQPNGGVTCDCTTNQGFGTQCFQDELECSIQGSCCYDALFGPQPG